MSNQRVKSDDTKSWLAKLRRRKNWFVSLRIQSSGRINIGTSVHSRKDCSALRGPVAVRISGEIVNELPMCSRCCRTFYTDHPENK